MFRRQLDKIHLTLRPWDQNIPKKKKGKGKAVLLRVRYRGVWWEQHHSCSVSSGKACLCRGVPLSVYLGVWAAGLDANFKTNFMFVYFLVWTLPLCIRVQCSCTLLASISFAVGEWGPVRGRSCGSQENYVQVIDALCGTCPYYCTIFLCSWSTHIKAIMHREEEASSLDVILIAVLLLCCTCNLITFFSSFMATSFIILYACESLASHFMCFSTPLKFHRENQVTESSD